MLLLLFQAPFDVNFVIIGFISCWSFLHKLLATSSLSFLAFSSIDLITFGYSPCHCIFEWHLNWNPIWLPWLNRSCPMDTHAPLLLFLHVSVGVVAHALTPMCCKFTHLNLPCMRTSHTTPLLPVFSWVGARVATHTPTCSKTTHLMRSSHTISLFHIFLGRGWWGYRTCIDIHDTHVWQNNLLTSLSPKKGSIYTPTFGAL